jgi:hypothetical protein
MGGAPELEPEQPIATDAPIANKQSARVEISVVLMKSSRCVHTSQTWELPLAPPTAHVAIQLDDLDS